MEKKVLPLQPSQDEFLHISPEGLSKLTASFDPSEPLRNIIWTTDHTVELPIYIKKEGPGSEKAITLVEMIETAVASFGKRPALRVKRSGQWKTWTYDEFLQDIKHFANALISIGISASKPLNIIGFNDPAWFIGFFGAIFAQVLPIGVYTTSGPEACKYIAEHSEAEIVLAEDNVHLKKYLEIWHELPKLKYIVIYNETALPVDIPPERRSKIILWKDFLELGAKYGTDTKDEQLNQRKRALKPGNCCTIIYTSGTTGPPKGVMLNHDSYTWLGRIFLKYFDQLFPDDLDDLRAVSYLPLSHVAAQFADMILPVMKGACNYFALPTALQGSLVETLKEVRPHAILSVPRLWEKIEETLKAMGKTSTFPRKNIADWAKSMGVEGTLAELEGKPTPFGWGIGKAVVYNNIKKALGLENCRALAYGAAPLSESSRTYFASLNLFLINIYGMSECAGPQTYYCPGKGMEPTLNSANVSLPGTELIIVNPDADGNGEICFKGRHRFMGYYKDEASTKSTIDAKGYLHSGDVGHVKENGHLYITGRLKELIITGGGENIAPVLIEEQVKTTIPELSQVVVIGDGRKFLTMLITLKHEPGANGIWTENLSTNILKDFRARNISAKNTKDLRTDANFVKYMQEQLDKLNAKAPSRVHTIRKWHLLDGDFSIDGGEFTPTLKLKRKIIAKKYAKEIEELYQEPKL